jgi:CubicO group peptidase (beta-lactamase class C family)
VISAKFTAMNLDRVAALFHENFTTHGELGASLSIWHNGREVLGLAEGFRDRPQTIPWTAETPVLFWSATKGLAAACVLHALQEHRIGLERRVAEFWPEFAAAGKGSITLAELLSHRAGLPALSLQVSVLDHDAVVSALAREEPHWMPGQEHGYHPRTFGFLLDEVLRRMTGKMLQEYWRTHFAEPLGLAVWIGVPPEMVEQIAPVFPTKNALPEGDLFYKAFAQAGSFTARAFGSPRGLHSVAAMNAHEARTSSFPAFGGVGTAQSLAKFYAMLACGGELEGRRFFLPPTLAQMTTTLAQGFDKVLMMDTAFSAGFMRDPVRSDGSKERMVFGPSPRAFGHPGAGGSHAFADPETRISFAYVMNQMEPGVLPNAKSLRLVEALYA